MGDESSNFESSSTTKDEHVDNPTEAEVSTGLSSGSIVDLHGRLRKRSAALIEDAIRNGGVPKEEVEKLYDLWRLVDLHRRIQPARRRQWMVLGLAMLVPFALFVSLIMRVPTLAISLEARISEIAFAVTERQELTDGLVPTQISVSGLKEIRLPRSRGRPAATLTLGGAGAVTLVALEDAGDEASPGRLTLAPLTLPGESHCRVASGEADLEHIRLSLRTAKLDLRVSVHGRIQVRIPGEADFDLVVSSPRSVDLLPRGDQIEIDLLFTEMPARLLQPRLAIDALDLTRIDEAETDEGTLVHRISTIRSGTLYSETLERPPRTLRQDQMLLFAASRGRLRTLGLEKDAMVLSYSGEVRGMTLGASTAARSLMPSVLQWLHQREGLTFLWAATLALLVFAQALVAFRKES